MVIELAQVATIYWIILLICMVCLIARCLPPTGSYSPNGLHTAAKPQDKTVPEEQRKLATRRSKSRRSRPPPEDQKNGHVSSRANLELNPAPPASKLRLIEAQIHPHPTASASESRNKTRGEIWRVRLRPLIALRSYHRPSRHPSLSFDEIDISSRWRS